MRNITHFLLNGQKRAVFSAIAFERGLLQERQGCYGVPSFLSMTRASGLARRSWKGGLCAFAFAACIVVLVEHKKCLADALFVGWSDHWSPAEFANGLHIGDPHGGGEE